MDKPISMLELAKQNEALQKELEEIKHRLVAIESKFSPPPAQFQTEVPNGLRPPNKK
jgi:hypothetical protein